MYSNKRVQTKYTPERLQIVREMTVQGFTGGEIAKKLGDGTTRNMVAGMRRYLGIKSPNSSLSAKTCAAKALHGTLGKVPTNAHNPVAVNTHKGKGLLTLVELKEESCRYPFGSIYTTLTFCGQTKKQGSSYCDLHHSRCSYGFSNSAGRVQ